MNIPELVIFVSKSKATELRLGADQRIEFLAGGKTFVLGFAKFKAADFEAQVIQRLGPFDREKLRTTGRCDWQFEVAGVGKVVVEVEPGKARLVLPAGPP